VRFSEAIEQGNFGEATNVINMVDENLPFVDMIKKFGFL
jgi:hypothetical protein